MARRHRTRLGSSPAAHTKAADISSKKADKLYDEAFAAADSNKCPTALKLLNEAHFYMGQTLADMKGSGEYAKRRNTRSDPENYMGVMKSLSNKIVDQCAKARVASRRR